MISPCRYCGLTPQKITEQGKSRLPWRCTASQYALEVIGPKRFDDERLMEKDWNATNDPNGPDIVRPPEADGI